MPLRKRLPEDLPQILRMLQDASLPSDGIENTLGWVAESNGVIIGHLAAERTEDAAVLRSLVVVPDHQGQGIGGRLLALAESELQNRSLVLKTETVGSWVGRRGYRRVSAEQAPASVRTTTQFAGSLCASTPLYIKSTTNASISNDAEAIKASVRTHYAAIVTEGTGCCSPAPSKGKGKGCGCGSRSDLSLRVGYGTQDLDAVPDGANLGLGCGNPIALASLQPGEVVLDLGSGAGFDAFLASPRVGSEGRVIGVDMTPEMLERARDLAKSHGYTNVEFRKGDIEALPVEDASVDIVISNCVINLTTDKAKAFREAFRVLKPGGRLMVSDLVLLNPIPSFVREDMETYAACVGGALPKADYLEAVRLSGFTEITVAKESRYAGDPSAEDLEAARIRNPKLTQSVLEAAMESVVSVQVQALKPAASESPEADCTRSPACKTCC